MATISPVTKSRCHGNNFRESLDQFEGEIPDLLVGRGPRSRRQITVGVDRGDDARTGIGIKEQEGTESRPDFPCDR